MIRGIIYSVCLMILTLLIFYYLSNGTSDHITSLCGPPLVSSSSVPPDKPHVQLSLSSPQLKPMTSHQYSECSVIIEFFKYFANRKEYSGVASNVFVLRQIASGSEVLVTAKHGKKITLYILLRIIHFLHV